MLLLKGPGWRDSLVVKSTVLLPRTQVLFQHPHGGSQLQFQGIRRPLLTILGSYTDTVPIHTLKHTHIQFKHLLHAYTNQLLSHYNTKPGK